MSPSTIIKRLNAAHDWLALPPTIGMAGQRKHYAGTDDVIVAEIVVGCVGLLGQSPRSYAGWVARHGTAVRALDRRAVRRLVSLTMSDVSIALGPLMVSYHFDQFIAGPLARETRERRARECAECGKRFQPAKRERYCSESCQKRAATKWRKTQAQRAA